MISQIKLIMVFGVETIIIQMLIYMFRLYYLILLKLLKVFLFFVIFLQKFLLLMGCLMLPHLFLFMIKLVNCQLRSIFLICILKLFFINLRIFFFIGFFYH